MIKLPGSITKVWKARKGKGARALQSDCGSPAGSAVSNGVKAEGPDPGPIIGSQHHRLLGIRH